jgi:curved DNA-binding protein
MVQNALYDVLGVSVRVDTETLKRAYRKLAKQLHPDRNPGNRDAELKFKAVNQAYAVLSDTKRRALYDEFGDESLRTNFDAGRSRARGGRASADASGAPARDAAGIRTEAVAVRTTGVSTEMRGASNGLDVLGNLFRRRAPAMRGADYETEIAIDFAEAVRGTARLLNGIPGAGAVLLRVPRGTANGGVVRVVGAGGPSIGDAPSGDLKVTIRVRPHAHFRREGNDLHLQLPITLREAYFGGRVKVPTPDGAVQLKIPRLSQSGQVLRVQKKGVAPEVGPAGDLLVHLAVQAPTAESLEVARAIEKIAEQQKGDPRAGIAL